MALPSSAEKAKQHQACPCPARARKLARNERKCLVVIKAALGVRETGGEARRLRRNARRMALAARTRINISARLRHLLFWR